MINKNRRNMIATGSSNGLIHVWRIGSQLVEPQDGTEELTAINELADEPLAKD